MTDTPENTEPSYTQIAAFYVKSRLLKTKRRLKNLRDPIFRHKRSTDIFNGDIIASSITPLWTNDNPKEMDLTAGKIHNLRLACSALNNVVVPGNTIFSFWKQIGRASKLRGFVEGREIREGCIIPTIGGGICQLSNALYDSAIKAGFQILERHAHTKVIAGSLAEKNRDATVFWNYVDLRFKAKNTFKIQAFMTSQNLIIRFIGDKQDSQEIKDTYLTPSNIGNCFSCGKTECPRHVAIDPGDIKYGKTAYVLDAFWPEHDNYLKSGSNENAIYISPIDGNKWKKQNYAWNIPQGARHRTFTLQTIKRGRAIRKLKPNGTLQRKLFEMDRKLALSMMKQLTYDVSHVVISQNLLPFLWEEGALWGRTFDVLMNRLPYYEIHKNLDEAYLKHPNSSTLNDFRINESWIETEKAALDAASKLITPHSAIAKLYPEKSIQLKWHLNDQNFRNNGVNRDLIIFGGPPLARKGILEFMEALKGMNLKIAAPGKAAETDLIRSMIMPLPADWYDRAKCVVLPAYVENQPRLLLKAVENGIPTIVSRHCGIDDIDGIHVLDQVNSIEIRERIERLL